MEKALNKDSIFTKFMTSKFMKKVIEIKNYLSKKSWFTYILFLYVVCFFMFIYVLIRNSMTIPIAGDFVLQEIPFYYNGYDDWWHAIKTGEFVLWDDSAFLGVNNIGANTFYYLFNPFFLVLLLVPRAILPQAQAFMMITKMVLAGVSMRLLLQHFKLKEETCWLFGVAYAFCGWNLYYLWFNHFLEIAVLMPLVLLGIEKIIKEQKPILLMIVLFVSGLTNYFFLICFCFCGVIYAIFRYFQNLKSYNAIMRENKNTHERILDVRIQVILQGIFAFMVGLLLAGLILAPCFSAALSTPRAAQGNYLTQFKVLFDNFKTVWHEGGDKKEAFVAMWNYLFKWPVQNGQKYTIYPLIAFFTPNVSCFDSVIFNNSYYDNTYASMFIYTPILLFFIPSVFQALKKRSVSTIIGLLGIGFLLFTPFAYYCFSGFTSVSYARWYIFVTAIAIVFIANQYEQKEKMSIWYLDISFGVILVIYGYLMFQGALLLKDPNTSNIREMDDASYYLYAQLIYLVFAYIYLRKNYKKPDFTYNARYLVAFEAIAMCNITLIGQGTSNYNNLYMGRPNIKEEIALAEQLKKDDSDYYRVFSTTANRDGNNLAMMLGTPGVGTFHSIYDFELQDFIDWSTVSYNGSWSMGIHEKRVNLDTFLGIKYYILKQGDTNVPFGFSEYISTDTHVVYINDNYIPLGYAFDTIYNASSFGDYEHYLPFNELTDCFSNTVLGEDAYLSGAILQKEDLQELQELYPDFDYKQTLDSENIKSVSPSNNRIKVYKAKWENNAFAGYETPKDYSSEVTKALTWNSYMDVNLKGLNVASDASETRRCYLTIQARMGENLEITLYGEKEDGTEYILTKDHHMTHWYADKQYDRKKQRGFYVDDEVTRMEVRIFETMSNKQSLLRPVVTMEYEDVYLSKIASLKKNPLQDIEMNTNDFSFSTNYNEAKMIVLQIPYDKGWSLEAFDKDGKKIDAPKIYKSTGGFLSFATPEGEYRYKMRYDTPYLNVGFYLLDIGALLYGIYFMTVYCYDTRKNAWRRKIDYPFSRAIKN